MAVYQVYLYQPKDDYGHKKQPLKCKTATQLRKTEFCFLLR